MEIVRCAWPKSELMLRYHDEEWGVPVHDDRKHFEFLLLESMQAGLSWEIVLRKRENYRRAFHGFEPDRVAAMSEQDIDLLMQDSGLIRNRAKLTAAVTNARRFLEIQEEFGSFNAYIWDFVGGHQPLLNAWAESSQIPATTPESDALSKDLRKRGFKFTGATVMYSHMQAAGLINDHLTACFRHAELRG
jgi:DNA-3-methyladenine glycosylase I